MFDCFCCVVPESGGGFVCSGQTGWDVYPTRLVILLLIKVYCVDWSENLTVFELKNSQMSNKQSKKLIELLG